MTEVATHGITLGARLRFWRQIRALSQLDLSHRAGISTRHLSFLETGRSQASRGMVLRLSEALNIPARERNLLLKAAGYAEETSRFEFTHPGLADIRLALERLSSDDAECSADWVDQVRQGIVGFDNKNRIIAWNGYMEEMTGVDTAAVIGQVAHDVFPFLIETGEKDFMELALKGHDIRLQRRIFNVPSSRRGGLMDIRHRPLLSPHNHILCGLNVVKDITLECQRDEARRDLAVARATAGHVGRALEEVLTLVAGSLENLASALQDERGRSLLAQAEEAARLCGGLAKALQQLADPGAAADADAGGGDELSPTPRPHRSKPPACAAREPSRAL